MSLGEWGKLGGVALAAAVLGGVGGGLAVTHLSGSAAGGVRAYLLDHPEVIPEAMQKLQEREMAKAVEASRPAIFTPFGNAWTGNPKGDVTLVEYFDYNCGYCRASLPTIDALIASDPKVKIVFRELPILSAQSRDAAKMSLAAAEQGKFKAFHDALYAAGPVSAASIAGAAQRAGVDMARAAAMVPRAEAEIDSNMAAARALGMSGTPTWVIGSKVLSSAMPLADLQKAVADLRSGK